jgi:hypothetical protein
MRAGDSSVRTGPFGIAALALSLLLMAAASVCAQSSPPAPAASSAPLPPPGFMPPYEVTKVVRSAGFAPLAPPLREGTTYVLRATDFRGILMRVVVDAHSGAIRAVNRIVPGPAPYGEMGMATPPYEMPPPYLVLPEAGAPIEPDETGLAPPPPAPAIYPAPHPVVSVPLPRPRPAELAARDAKLDAKPELKPDAKPDAYPAAKPAEASAATPGPAVTTITTAPPVPAAPKKPAQPAIPD